MRIRGFRYFFKEAIKNIFSNGWMTVASLFTVIASLLVLGVFLLISMNLNNMVGQIEDSYEIIAVLDDKTSGDGISAIGKDLGKIDNVSAVELDAKDERLEDLKGKFGDNASLLDRYRDDNPLRNWYRVTLNDLTAADDTVRQIEEINGVSHVIRSEEALNNLVRVANYIKNFSLWIIVALAIVSVFIISNTIKLTVYARRREINIMKFVGATDWFIRWPFIIEGIIIGILGSCAAVAAVLVAYHFLLGFSQTLNILFIQLIPFETLAPYIAVPCFGLGAVLGGVGSFISVRKHLNV